ncbi:MAG TPA: hypothetical protein VMW72_06005 [Sedimentisphaerales bacterium]|nr:hypothetical protein [Sedimentisphaerales bacterium]
MKTAKRQFVSLEALAVELHLPKSYLRALVNKKLIPYLDVNGRLRFDPVLVVEALTNLASGNGEGKSDDKA